ncbi:MAG: hypothetical protein AABX45_01160, partial [Nanoarchaeota archaeon]
MNNNFQEKVFNSFKKVKEDIDFLRKELNKVKEFLLLQNKELISLKTKIKEQNDLIITKSERNNKSSTGNDRAINNHQQSST